MRPKARLYLDASDGQNLFGDGRYQLLKTVDEEGSLLRAAERLERGYRKAWGDIRRTEQALGRKLVITNRGGPTGGATQLTEFAQRLLTGWDRFRDDVESRMVTASGEHLGFFGRGIMVLIDTHGRAIQYLRISVTDRCNLRCSYCMPADGIELKQCSDMLSYEQITEITKAAARVGITKIRLTGGEPLVRRGLEDLIRMLAAIDGIDEIAMTTNAVMLTRPRAEGLREAGLDRLNISLDTLDAERYRALTRGGRLEEALAGIEEAAAAGFERTKINMVIFDSTTREEISSMREFCSTEGLDLQRIKHFSLTGDVVSIGPDVPCERPMPCDMCNRLRLTSDGFFKPCLMSDSEIEVDFEDIEGCLRRAVEAKPQAGTSCNGRSMRQIGG